MSRNCLVQKHTRVGNKPTNLKDPSCEPLTYQTNYYVDWKLSEGITAHKLAVAFFAAKASVKPIFMKPDVHLQGL